MNYWMFFILSTVLYQAPLKATTSLESLIDIGLENNPDVQTMQHHYEAEDSLIAAQYTPQDPSLGIANLNRGNETTYSVFSQNIKFPVKYYLMGKAQRSKALSAKYLYGLKRIQIAQHITRLYYAIYTLQKTIILTKANMSSVREFARVAERKYAAGKTSQADSMKAHFEITQLELELIRLNQQQETLQEELKASLNNNNFEKLIFNNKELKIPQYYESKVTVGEGAALAGNSAMVKSQKQLVDMAQWKSSLAKWDFAPDIKFAVQNRIDGLPEDSQIYSVNLTFPLWFWRKTALARAASSKRRAAESRLVSVQNKVIAKVEKLKGKVKVGVKTLQIYKTSLVPQAQSAYRSTLGAYRANKTSFLNLLDSERSLFKVRTGFYQTLNQYIIDLTALETELGFRVSNISKWEIKNEIK